MERFIACALAACRAKLQRKNWRISCTTPNSSRRSSCGWTINIRAVAARAHLLFVLHRVNAVPCDGWFFRDVLLAPREKHARRAILRPAFQNRGPGGPRGAPVAAFVRFARRPK